MGHKKRKNKKTRGRYRALNPNRVALGIIIARTESMITEMQEIKLTIEDMVWNMNYEDQYYETLESIEDAIAALNRTAHELAELYKAEPPGWE